MGLHSFSKKCLFATGLLRKMEWKRKESFDAERKINKVVKGRNRGPQWKVKQMGHVGSKMVQGGALPYSALDIPFLLIFLSHKSRVCI